MCLAVSFFLNVRNPYLAFILTQNSIILDATPCSPSLLSLSEILGFLRLRFLDGVFLSYFLDRGFVGGRVAESVLSSPCDGMFLSCAWLCWRGLWLCVPFFSSLSPVRIPFWVFCWFVLLRGPRVGVFPFLSAEVQGLEHRRGVSSKWAHWQHTLWWVSSPWSGHREAGALHSQNQCDALSSYL